MDLSEIKTRLTKLETSTEERWNAHDKRAEEMSETIQRGFEKVSNHIGKIFDKITDIELSLRGLPCGDRLQRIKFNKSLIFWIMGIFAAVFISALGIILRLAFLQ